MIQENLQKTGRITACITPAAWALFFIVGFLYGNIRILGGIDVGMIWLYLVIVPMMHIGTIASAVWLVCAWRHRCVFAARPRLVIGCNIMALLLGLLQEVPLWWSHIA